MKLRLCDDDFITLECKNIICKMYVDNELIREENVFGEMKEQK